MYKPYTILLQYIFYLSRSKTVQQNVYQVHIKSQVEIYFRTVLFYLTKSLYIYIFFILLTKYNTYKKKSYVFNDIPFYY